jgi:tetratricopeptide (TPR) repeat protein
LFWRANRCRCKIERNEEGKAQIMAQARWHALKCEAVRWRRLKNPAQAIECLIRAVEITRQSPDLTRETGSMLGYLADLYLQDGQLAQAEAAIREALQNGLSLPAAERGLGADDFMILAKVLSKQGRHQEAYEAGSQALASFRKQFGTHDKFFGQIQEMVEELRHNVTASELSGSAARAEGA